ncbi:hypothetical protein [Aureliella helgolandensis]|uniref:Uncharacterized protein n=1 Tax=Aureliella helgolandensis TaxID=2527968 RepID=A0A518GFT1_9BACT|nr:hypothetical protein [Aureliella helgolandensis]QDV27454.1 hypothetical protein Q31a_58430 [Aureliella helgolandensis]
MIDISRSPTATPRNRIEFESIDVETVPNQPGAGVRPLLDSAQQWIRKHPGKCLFAGLVLGGVAGWFTSKLR